MFLCCMSEGIAARFDFLSCLRGSELDVPGLMAAARFLSCLRGSELDKQTLNLLIF